MKLRRHRLASSALIVFLAGTTSVLAQEQKISCDAVPTAVRAAFEKAFPKAAINGCAREIEKGKIAYEIQSIEGKTSRDALFGADGTVIVVEETIAFGSVPDPVQQTVRNKYPDGEIARAEKVMRDATVLYEFRIKQRGRLTEVVFDPAGNEVKP